MNFKNLINEFLCLRERKTLERLYLTFWKQTIWSQSNDWKDMEYVNAADCNSRYLLVFHSKILL